MNSFTTAIIIKMFGIVVAAFLIATSTFFYFEYHQFFSVIGIMIGVGIFILSLKLETKIEAEKDDKNGKGVKT